MALDKAVDDIWSLTQKVLRVPETIKKMTEQHVKDYRNISSTLMYLLNKLVNTSLRDCDTSLFLISAVSLTSSRRELVATGKFRHFT